MALQAGMGLSRIVFLVGAGYTGTILIKNNKLSEILGELQNFAKGLESAGDSANADADPIVAQVRWLAQEVSRLASTRQITLLNNGSSSSQTDMSFLVLPAATLGALGYCYMWWNGFSVSDLMYVTKASMAAAVGSLKENLQGIYTGLEKAKTHLLLRIQNLDDKMEENRELQKETLNEVRSARVELENVKDQFHVVVGVLNRLEDNMTDFDRKQILTLLGVDYLVQYANGKLTNAGFAQEFRREVQSRCQFAPSENLGLQGLLSVIEDESDDAHQPKNFMRSTSVEAAVVLENMSL